jgi:SAM-dependent methyltransferase
MLAEAGAVEVIGVDLDAECVAIARRTFCHPALRFVRASGIALPYPSGAFDLVTSFETLEHIEAAECFVRELRRVTNRDGQLILSTPNLLCTSRYPRNPFHVREFTPGELAELLGRFYDCVEIRGQRVAPYYRIVPFLPGRERARTFLDHFRLIAWKLGNRLPFRAKDLLARACTGHHFYPAEADYSFENGVDDNVPVLVATCHAAK